MNIWSTNNATNPTIAMTEIINTVDLILLSLILLYYYCFKLFKKGHLNGIFAFLCFAI
jgi:hypothetical protein